MANEMQAYIAGMKHLGAKAAEPDFLARLPDTGPRAAAEAITDYAATLDGLYPNPETNSKAECEAEYYNGARLIYHTSEVTGLLRWLYCDPSIEADALAAGSDLIARWRGMFQSFHDIFMRSVFDTHPDDTIMPPILKPKTPACP